MAKKQNKKTVIRFNFSWIYFLIILGIGYLLFQNSGPGPQKIEWTAVKRTHDGQYQAVADEDENGFTAEKGKTFLQSVYAPSFTTGG